MAVFDGKNIVIGITGGIAAYKSADLARRLMDAAAEVRIVMTSAATEFVTPLTFQALTGHPVFFDNSDDSASSGMKHIELARWADAIIIAPASANTIAKLAHGRADNLLTTLCLASESSKCFAPAMNRVMWEDASTQQNCQTLQDKNWLQLGPDNGLQACGETGEGRMLDVADIMQQLASHLSSGVLAGVKLVITAGPTYEAIDPVRYIGNRSSGRMGYAIAQAAKEAGAFVTLISGPCNLPQPEVNQFISVESAEQMKQAVFASITDSHIFVSTAAVADYRVKQPAEQKIKKTADSLSLELVKNDDIISLVAQHKTRPYVVGFAAETENLVINAKDKLVRKNLDMIVANDVSTTEAQNTPAIGFNSEYNVLHVFTKANANSDFNEKKLSLARKSVLAKQLIMHIAEQYKNNKNQHAKNSA